MLYQYLWKYRLLGDRLEAVGGATVEVLYQGRLNTDAGPDFIGARLRIDGQEWCGSVEVHVRASDWGRHGHDSDPAYNNVILHVVAISDARISDGRGGKIPQVIATFPESFMHIYALLSEKISAVNCEPLLKTLPRLTVSSWLDTLSVERMQAKAERVLQTVNLLEGDWEWACFVALARAMGFGLNSEPLERLARSIPLKILAKHSDDLLQTEALLFGQAGMLDTSVHIFDEYYQRLCREYYFLARKYGLKPLRSDIWMYARTRPQNFPHRRIALLARTLYGGFSLMSKITSPKFTGEQAYSEFNWHLDGYWLTHSGFDLPGSRLPETLSAANLNLLMINFVAPVVYAYGASRGNPDLAERGLDIWTDLRPENNTYIRQWQRAGIVCESASDSQALLQLRREYCDHNRCLECRFGHALLREASHSVSPEYSFK